MIPKWSEVQAKVAAGITASQAALERMETSAEDTIYHRGRIAAYRDVLAMARTAPDPIAQPDFG